MTFQPSYSDSSNYWWYPAVPYYPMPGQIPYNVGWSCPRCGKVWSPSVTSCDCSYRTTTGNTWVTTGNDTSSNTVVTSFSISGDWTDMAETISNAMDIQRKVESTDDDDDDGSDPIGVPA